MRTNLVSEFNVLGKESRDYVKKRARPVGLKLRPEPHEKGRGGDM